MVHHEQPSMQGPLCLTVHLWSSDTTGNLAFAIFWDVRQGTVHMEAFPKSDYGFCRFVKKERPNKKKSKPLMPDTAAIPEINTLKT